ncbi:MAG: large conductance mechanosensitive channel protein MscL [Bacteroidetes bacterium HGW-Bacteroidetes-6]|jgi:large conductance mechanosensitive channel|nr:MAG: large conductance mechanosensitive channel protein MscL [Bacteroidetes bacterium HGW-Bacteroidetes-6]
MKIFKEFREFISRGNVLDLAVAVVLGGAFGKIVASFVNDVLMPPIGILLGGVDFKDLSLLLKDGSPAVMDGATVVSPEVPAVTLNYGMFVQNIIDFLIIAFSVFIVVRVANKLTRKKEAAPAEPPKPSNEEILLAEIRDLLKQK